MPICRRPRRRCDPGSRVGAEAAESKLGPDHPDTLAIRNNLAHLLAAGRIAEAIPIYEATLKMFESKLGPTTPTRSSAATTSPTPTGPPAVTPRRSRSTSRRSSSASRSSAPTTRIHSSRNNLATAYRAAGRFAEAIPILESKLKLASRSSAPTIPTRSHPNNLAQGYESLNRWADAEPLRRDNLATKPKGAEAATRASGAVPSNSRPKSARAVEMGRGRATTPRMPGDPRQGDPRHWQTVQPRERARRRAPRPEKTCRGRAPDRRRL